jgi:hypothetical protein
MVGSCSTHGNDDKFMQYFGCKTSRKELLIAYWVRLKDINRMHVSEIKGSVVLSHVYQFNEVAFVLHQSEYEMCASSL